MYKRVYRGGVEHKLRPEVGTGDDWCSATAHHRCQLVWQCIRMLRMCMLT